MNDQSQPDHDKRLASLVKTTPPFIGRRVQIAFFDHCLTELIAGRPQVLLIQGDAGVGKTRLLKEFRSLALSRGVNVCFGRCREDRPLPYLPFADSLFFQLQQLPEEMRSILGADMEIIDRFLHQDEVLTPTVPSSLSSQTDQNTLRLFLALSHATIKLAQNRPLLLAVDDLQWADRSSLDLFSHLVFAVADAALGESLPLLIIGSHRPVEPEDQLARVIARFQREEICRVLELSGLEEGEVNELIQALVVKRPAHQLVATVSKATSGNPLFIQEVMNQLEKRGALEDHDDYVVTTVPPSELRLPACLTDKTIEGHSRKSG